MVLCSLQQEGYRHVPMCAYCYRGWNIEQYFTAVDGHSVRVYYDEVILGDWLFGKNIQAQEKALEWFDFLIYNLRSMFRPYDCPTGDQSDLQPIVRHMHQLSIAKRGMFCAPDSQRAEG